MRQNLSCIVFTWLSTFSFFVHAQLKSTCETCFQSEITSALPASDRCTNYTIKVFYSERCAHDLSHFTVAIPSCYSISHLSNDLSCAQVIGYDPTTGLTGFKIDNISNFGSSNRKSFNVSFTLCSNDLTSCSPSCWSPTVAYKAGNCFELDTLQGICPKLSAHLVQKNVSCYGLQDGQLTVVTDAGQAPFQYSWSNAATTSSVQNLKAGNYSVTVTDATHASVTLSTVITQPDSIRIMPTVNDATCNGVADGSIALAVSGGSGAPYSFLWSNGRTTSLIDSLKAGSYTAIVKDSAGCSARTTLVLGNKVQLTLSEKQTLPSCHQSNGSITVTISGGTAPYTYQWSNGGDSSSLAHLAAGNYSVTAKDAEGCLLSSSFNLRENNTLRISYFVTPTSCLDDHSGAIDLMVSGGTPPYSFSWSNGSTSEDIAQLSAGIYQVTVTDSLGCQATARISVYKKTFSIAPQLTQPLCAGDSTGAITVTPSGGVSPYYYQWSTGDDTSSISQLSPGIYTVTVTDSIGCSRLLSYSITAPAPLQVTDSVQSISCDLSSIHLQVSGGISPYHFIWSTGATTEDLTNVNSGVYSVTVTDANGCRADKQITVDSTASWSCAIVPVTPSPDCLSSNNKIFTRVSGAIYQWQLTSTDGSWLIQSGASQDTLVYSAGNAHSSATFKVTITKDGCTRICTYTLSSCNSTSAGGGNDESCKDCFTSRISQSSMEETCVSYTVVISTDGNCRYDLSHFVIAIPCGELSHYSDSENWPLAVGYDPTTGLTGLKVDNVSNFGKTIGSFTLQFDVCFPADCRTQMTNWNPVVAYKAGQCIAYDTLTLSTQPSVCQYPNPFEDSFNLDITTPEENDWASVEILDQYGKSCGNITRQPLKSSVKNVIKVEASFLPQNIYLYKVRTSKSIHYGRMVKSK
jgi:hypothetical protein